MFEYVRMEGKNAPPYLDQLSKEERERAKARKYLIEALMSFPLTGLARNLMVTL